MESRFPQEKLTIVGGGIVGALEAYFAYLDAEKRGEKIKITIHEKNKLVTDTTTGHLVPSLTPDEILSVVPIGDELVKQLQISFQQPGGIRVDDADCVNDTDISQQFVMQVKADSHHPAAQKTRIEMLLALGKKSMDLWQSIYNNADAELKQILNAAHFNPCREKTHEKDKLHDGYRIDLIYNHPNPKQRANLVKTRYEEMGYLHCKILTPKEVMLIDPFLTDFCKAHSIVGSSNELEWKQDALALWRPAGCLDSQTFLPLFYAYLQKKLGVYKNAKGETKNCFQLHLNRNVIGVSYEAGVENNKINGLNFFGRASKSHESKKYAQSSYVFCPGEAIGTLNNLGFSEPVCASFAGASLILKISVPENILRKYVNLDHYMSIIQAGIAVVWQARVQNNKLFIGIAGAKAFYSNQKPHKDQAFAKNRNLFQLNIINDLLPELVSIALSKNTKGKLLTAEDLAYLERIGIAERWVGTRAVAYDGFPTLGALYHEGRQVENARTTTHLGSGGGSFSPAVILASQSVFINPHQSDKLTQDILQQSGSNRRALLSAL